MTTDADDTSRRMRVYWSPPYHRHGDRRWLTVSCIVPKSEFPLDVADQLSDGRSLLTAAQVHAMHFDFPVAGEWQHKDASVDERFRDYVWLQFVTETGRM